MALDTSTSLMMAHRLFGTDLWQSNIYLLEILPTIDLSYDIFRDERKKCLVVRGTAVEHTPRCKTPSGWAA